MTISDKLGQQLREEKQVRSRHDLQWGKKVGRSRSEPEAARLRLPTAGAGGLHCSPAGAATAAAGRWHPDSQEGL